MDGFTSNGEISANNVTPDQPASQVWLRPWSVEELRSAADNWSLASDAGLYFYLIQSSKASMERTMATRRNLEELRLSYQDIHVEAENGMNSLDMLSNHQFLENLVADDTEELTMSSTHTAAETVPDRSHDDVVSVMRDALQLGLTVLKEKYERIDVRNTTELDEETASMYGDGTGSISLAYVEPLYQPKDPYERRHLPHFIGSRAFLEDDTLGIGLLDEEEEPLTDPEEEVEDIPDTPERPFVEGDVTSSSEEEEDNAPIPVSRGATAIEHSSNTLSSQMFPSISAPRDATLQSNRVTDMFVSDQEDNDSDEDIWSVPKKSQTSTKVETLKPVTDEETEPLEAPQPAPTLQSMLTADLNRRFSQGPRKAKLSSSEEEEDSDNLQGKAPVAARTAPAGNKPPSSDGRFNNSTPANKGNHAQAPPAPSLLQRSQPPAKAPITRSVQKLFDSDNDSDNDDDWLFSTAKKPSKPLNSNKMQSNKVVVSPPGTDKANMKEEEEDDQDWLLPAAKSAQSSVPVVKAPGQSATLSNAKSAASGIFSDDEDDDLFKPPSKTSTLPAASKPLNALTPAPVAISQPQPVKEPKPPAPLEVKKAAIPVKSSLWSDEEDDDLFGALTTKAAPTKVLTLPTAKAPVTVEEKKQQTLGNVPATQSAKVLSVFDDDEEDDDLFGNLGKPQKKPTPAVATPQLPKEIEKPKEKPEPIKEDSKSLKKSEPSKPIVDPFADSDNENDLFDDMFAAKSKPPANAESSSNKVFTAASSTAVSESVLPPVEKNRKDQVTAADIVPTKPTPVAVNKSIFPESSDEDDPLFAPKASAPSGLSKAAVATVEKPKVNTPEPAEAAPVEPVIPKARESNKPVGGVALFAPQMMQSGSQEQAGAARGSMKEELEKKMKARMSLLDPKDETSPPSPPPPVEAPKNQPSSALVAPSFSEGLDDFLNFSSSTTTNNISLDFGAPAKPNEVLDSVNVLLSRAAIRQPARRRPSNLMKSNNTRDLEVSPSLPVVSETVKMVDPPSIPEPVKQVDPVPIKSAVEPVAAAPAPTAIKASDTKKAKPTTSNIEDDIFADLPTPTVKAKRTTSVKTAPAKSKSTPATKKSGNPPPALNVDDLDDIFAVDSTKKTTSSGSGTKKAAAKKGRSSMQKSAPLKEHAGLKALDEGEDDPLGVLK